MLTRASKRLSAVTSFPVQYNKAIVGRNAFAHESGIHQDGMLKNAETYEIMTPESVGVSKTSLVMGKHSGRHGVQGQAARARLRPWATTLSRMPSSASRTSRIARSTFTTRIIVAHRGRGNRQRPRAHHARSPDRRGGHHGRTAIRHADACRSTVPASHPPRPPATARSMPFSTGSARSSRMRPGTRAVPDPRRHRGQPMPRPR